MIAAETLDIVENTSDLVSCFLVAPDIIGKEPLEKFGIFSRRLYSISSADGVEPGTSPPTLDVRAPRQMALNRVYVFLRQIFLSALAMYIGSAIVFVSISDLPYAPLWGKGVLLLIALPFVALVGISMLQLVVTIFVGIVGNADVSRRLVVLGATLFVFTRIVAIWGASGQPRPW